MKKGQCLAHGGPGVQVEVSWHLSGGRKSQWERNSFQENVIIFEMLEYDVEVPHQM